MTDETKRVLEEVTNIVPQVYLVGGCVRDMILGRETHDYDFATHHSPEHVEELIRKNKRRPFCIGKRFGTIAVKILNGSNAAEITTFRAEKYHKGNRKPDVEFVKDLTADLQRRDFTINAISLKPTGKLIDPFGGQADLQQKVIRAVGNATTRFKEDPLRMLRACRFSSTLGFQIEEQTFLRMKQNAHLILNVSKERWTMELDKLLLGASPEIGLANLWASGLMKYILPEMHLQYGFDQHTEHHNFPLHHHTSLVVKNAPNDINMKWGALLHDVGKPFIYTDKGDRFIYPLHEVLGAEFVDKIGKYLKWSNARIETVKNIVLHHLEESSPIREADNMSK